MATNNLPPAVYIPIGEHPENYEAHAKITVAGADYIMYRGFESTARLLVRSDQRPPDLYSVAVGFSHPDLTEWDTYLVTDEVSLTLEEARLAAAP